MNLKESIANIPAKYLAKVESGVETLIACSDTTDGWDVLYEKKGLAAYRRSSVGSAGGSSVCVRGDLTMPFDVIRIFTFIYDLSKAKLRDPQVGRRE